MREMRETPKDTPEHPRLAIHPMISPCFRRLSSIPRCQCPTLPTLSGSPPIWRTRSCSCSTRATTSARPTSSSRACEASRAAAPAFFLLCSQLAHGHADADSYYQLRTTRHSSQSHTHTRFSRGHSTPASSARRTPKAISNTLLPRRQIDPSAQVCDSCDLRGNGRAHLLNG